MIILNFSNRGRQGHPNVTSRTECAKGVIGFIAKLLYEASEILKRTLDLSFNLAHKLLKFPNCNALILCYVSNLINRISLQKLSPTYPHNL